jgi:hypothetical protein
MIASLAPVASEKFMSRVSQEKTRDCRNEDRVSAATPQASSSNTASAAAQRRAKTRRKNSLKPLPRRRRRRALLYRNRPETASTITARFGLSTGRRQTTANK